MLKIETKKLQKMVGAVNKVKQSNILEITKYWHMVCTGDTLIMTGYDGNNHIRVIEENIKGKPFDIILRAEQFGKLVSKLSVEQTTLVPKDNFLLVKANGEYKIDLIQDEVYPDFDAKVPDNEEIESVVTISMKTIRDIAQTNKTAVSQSISDGIYVGYRLSEESAITTDTIRVCINPITIEELEEPILIRPEMLDMLVTIDAEEVNLFQWGDSWLYFQSDDIEVIGKQLEGIEDFADISEITETEFPGEVVLNKNDVINILDRLTLFLSKFDKNLVTLTFTEKQLEIQTTSGSFESIDYISIIETSNKSDKKAHEFSCMVNTTFIKDILAVVNEDNFVIKYGDDVLLNIESCGVEHFLATSEGDDDSVEFDEEEG